jgi:hypothetical protein
MAHGVLAGRGGDTHAWHGGTTGASPELCSRAFRDTVVWILSHKTVWRTWGTLPEASHNEGRCQDGSRWWLPLLQAWWWRPVAPVLLWPRRTVWPLQWLLVVLLIWTAVRGRLSSSLASMAIDNEDGSSVLVAKGARRGGFYRGETLIVRRMDSTIDSILKSTSNQWFMLGFGKGDKVG